MKRRIVDNTTGIVLNNVSIQREMLSRNEWKIFNLTDKNGVKLWEGDILTDGVNTFTIGYTLKTNSDNWYLICNETGEAVYKRLDNLTKL
jgi:hypothetical protein